jgi:hypothetical protein
LDYNPPREGEDYTLALEYAEKRYEEMLNLSEVLDQKLEGLARTSLAIGVLIATVARALGSNTPLGRSPLLICFGVALFCRPEGAETGKPRATPWGSDPNENPPSPERAKQDS